MHDMTVCAQPWTAISRDDEVIRIFRNGRPHNRLAGQQMGRFVFGRSGIERQGRVLYMYKGGTEQ